MEALLGPVPQRPVNLYRALANHPELLHAWARFASTLRWGCAAPRALRELLILRFAQLTEAEYERHHHLAMASAAGLSAERVDELAAWPSSALFDERERAALAYTEAVTAGSVSEEMAARLKRHYNSAEVVELTLTAGFYVMVSRVLNALRIPVEGREDPIQADFRRPPQL